MFGQKRTFYELLVSLGPMGLLCIIIPLYFLLATPVGLSTPLLLIGLVGIGFMSYAKWRHMAQGRFFIFDADEMTTIEKISYSIGYSLLIFSFLGFLLLFMVFYK